MADRQYPELTETKPKRPGLSLLSKGLAGADEFVSQNKLGALLSSGLGVPDAAKLLEKLAYGDRLTTGKGQTLKPAESVVEGGMALAPVLGSGLTGLGKLAKKIPLQRDSAPNALLPKKPHGGDLYSFKQSLSQQMGQKIGDIQTQIATRDWAFTPGAQLLSKTSGQTVKLKGKYIQKGEPVYFAEFTNPKTGDVYESTVKEAFLIDPSKFLPLDQQPADLASVNNLLQGFARGR